MQLIKKIIFIHLKKLKN